MNYHWQLEPEIRADPAATPPFGGPSQLRGTLPFCLARLQQRGWFTFIIL